MGGTLAVKSFFVNTFTKTIVAYSNYLFNKNPSRQTAEGIYCLPLPHSPHQRADLLTEIAPTFSLNWILLRLRLICDVDRYVIKEEIAACIACYINDPYAEVGVAKVGRIPCTAPCIGCATESIRGFRGAKVRRGLGCRPRCAAIP
jgi:hypothetical protein